MATGTRIAWLGRGQIALAICFVLGVAGVLLHGALWSPAVPLLLPGGAPWITVQPVLRLGALNVDLSRIPATVFERRFLVERIPDAAMLRVRALREVALTLNGQPVPVASDAMHWKEQSVADVAALLVPGENVFHAEVRNATGPAVFQLRLDGLSPALVTDPNWSATEQGRVTAPVVVADEAIVDPAYAAGLPSPRAGLEAHAIPLVAAVITGGVLASLLRGRQRAANAAPRAAILLLSGIWLRFVWYVVIEIPPYVGFDAEQHLRYISRLMESPALPRASEGWAMYHPPLYHAVTAQWMRLVDPGADRAVARGVVSLLPVLSGFGMAFVARSLARLLAPEQRWLEATALLVAGLLPMNLTLASCASNESLHALLASLALLVALRALVAPRARRRQDVALGLLLSAALLTKYSAALLVPVLVGAVAAKRIVAEEAPPRSAASGAAVSLGLILVLAGWFYVRNWWLFGDPFVWNLNTAPGRTWWQQPGFHLPAYFFRFGEAFVIPWCSGFVSFWDSLYSTLWGDGMLSGAGVAHGYRRWDWMAASFPLALPATGLVAAGWMHAGWRAARDRDPGRRIAFTLLVLLPPLLLASLLQVNLRLPMWSLGKAFYALFLTPALGFFAASGFDLVARRSPAWRGAVLRFVLSGWAAAFALSIVMAYGG